MWLAEALAHRGHDVTVITTAYDAHLFGVPEARGFRLVSGAFGGYAIDPLIHLRAGWQLRTLLAGYDWINPHNFPAYHWVFWARVFNPRIGPVIWFCEEPMRPFYPDICNPHVRELRRRLDPPAPTASLPLWRRSLRRLWHYTRYWRWETSRWLDRRMVPRLDLVLANSEFIASQVRRIFGCSAEPCLLGVPADRFTRLTPALRIPPPLIQGRFILTVSRLHVEKNIDTVLDAVAMLRQQGPLPFDRYVVAGEGPQRDALMARTARLGLSDIVTFLGFVADEELAALYAHAALVIYLPLDETYGLVFPEAGLFRKAVIGPNHGGPAEIIRHAETGFQVDPLDPAAVAGAIDTALRTPGLLERMGEANYHHTLSVLNFAKFVDRFEGRLAAARPAR